jgi:hypothetical protein
VRDALVVATAQIGRLVCDEWLGLWLYSLARAECLRREAVPASDADEPVALPNTDDADSRTMARKAVTSMPADEVEALELDSRHNVDLRLVLSLSAAEVQALLDRPPGTWTGPWAPPRRMRHRATRANPRRPCHTRHPRPPTRVNPVRMLTKLEW